MKIRQNKDNILQPAPVCEHHNYLLKCTSETEPKTLKKWLSGDLDPNCKQKDNFCSIAEAHKWNKINFRTKINNKKKNFIIKKRVGKEVEVNGINKQQYTEHKFIEVSRVKHLASMKLLSVVQLAENIIMKDAFYMFTILI